MGGMIAQVIAQQQPRLVRKMIIAGPGPAGGEGIDKVIRISLLDTARGLLTRQDPKQFLFFTSTPNGRRAGRTSWHGSRNARTTATRPSPSTRSARSSRRSTDGPADARGALGIHQPVLLMNGESDKIAPTANTVDLDRRLPNSQLVVYPDAGHGGVFQFHEDFVKRTLDFL